MRKETGKKVERSDFLADIVAPIFGYSLVAFFLSFPLVILSKFIGIAGSLMDTWLTIGFICFGVVAFLRQT
ncbi:putative four-helix membrane protein [Vibrio cholerae]